MRLQSTKPDHKTTNQNYKTCQKNRFVVTNHSASSKHQKLNYPEYLPHLSKKVMAKVENLELAKISSTKGYKSQPKRCKTEPSEKGKINTFTVYSQNDNINRIDFSKTRKIKPHIPWCSELSDQKQSTPFHTTNNITFHRTKPQNSSEDKNHSLNHTKKRSISKLQQPFHCASQFRAQTFQENIIRDRLKMKSSFEGGEQKRINGTVVFKGNRNQYLRTETNEYKLNDGEGKEDKTETQTQLKSTNFSKNYQDKRDLASLKNKRMKSNLYVPSFTHKKITSNVIQNLLKKVELQSQLKQYEAELYSRQLFSSSPQEINLQKQIDQIQIHFRKKKEWFSHQLQKQIKDTTANLNLTEVLNNSKERSRSQKIGKIVKQGGGPLLVMKKQTQSLYSEQRFQGVIESEESEEKTVVLHDNFYRKEIIQLDHHGLIANAKNSIGVKDEVHDRIVRMPSDELMIAEELSINRSTKKLNQNLISERPKSNYSAKERLSKSRIKNKASKEDQCIIF